jgi:signal transduction histidine kinase
MALKKLTSSLQTTMTATTVALAVLGLVVSGAFIVLTTYLHWTNKILGAAVESVGLAEQAEINLLLHGRAGDRLHRSALEGELRRALLQARDHVSTEQEARALHEAHSRVEVYLAAAQDPDLSAPEVEAHHDSAYRALWTLVTDNVAKAHAARAEAVRWDRAGNALGVVTALLPLGLAAWLLWWLRVRTIRPLLALAGSMERFGRGDRDVRADETGALELREMAVRFNAMASALAAQRQSEMAFLAGVAHDLRNPLAALQLSVDAVGPDRPLPPEPRLRSTVATVNRQIARMERMVGDFLDMAKIEAGELELKVETLDARNVVREVIELFGATSPQHRLETMLPEEAVLVCCDPLRLEQVLTNLVSNAIKYSPTGGLIEATLARRGDEVVLRVTDHGIGMSAEEQRHIFEPFRRAGLAKDAIPGLGLGLFVVKRIIEAHGGRIEVESAPDRGSTFSVHLPVSS